MGALPSSWQQKTFMIMDNPEWFRRQTRLKEVGAAGQVRLRQARILVIGAGGLGCPVLQYMCTAGIGHITLYDDDVVDSSNIHRQPLYGLNDTGKLKTDLAAERLANLYPWTKITSKTTRITVDNIHSAMESSDLVLDCTDSLETKFIVHDAAYQLKKTLIQAGLYQFEGHIAYLPFNREIDGCMRCVWPSEPLDGCVGTCADTGILGSVAGVVGTMQAHMALLHLLGLSQDMHFTQTLVDLRTFETQRVRIEKWHACPLCSGSNLVLKADEISYDITLDELPVDTVIYDIRETDEIMAMPCPADLKAQSIPLSQWFLTPPVIPSLFVALLCHSGKRSHVLARNLRREGYENVFSLHGGLMEIMKGKS